MDGATVVSSATCSHRLWLSAYERNASRYRSTDGWSSDRIPRDWIGASLSPVPISVSKSRSMKRPRCLEKTPLSYSKYPARRTQSRTDADPSIKSMRWLVPYLYVAGGEDA